MPPCLTPYLGVLHQAGYDLPLGTATSLVQPMGDTREESPACVAPQPLSQAMERMGAHQLLGGYGQGTWVGKAGDRQEQGLA